MREQPGPGRLRREAYEVRADDAPVGLGAFLHARESSRAAHGTAASSDGGAQFDRHAVLRWRHSAERPRACEGLLDRDARTAPRPVSSGERATRFRVSFARAAAIEGRRRDSRAARIRESVPASPNRCSEPTGEETCLPGTFEVVLGLIGPSCGCGRSIRSVDEVLLEGADPFASRCKLGDQRIRRPTGRR